MSISKMSDEAMYRAQGDRTGGVWAMPQPFIVQCVWFRCSIGNFSELFEILLSTLPCKNGFVTHMVIRNAIAGLYTFIISSLFISFFTTMGHLSFRSRTVITNSRNKVSCTLFVKTPIILDVLKYSKKTHFLLYYRNNTQSTESYVWAFRNENKCGIFVLHW